MTEPTPVTPISAPWESVGERLSGPRVGVDEDLPAPAGGRVRRGQRRRRVTGRGRTRLVATGHRLGGPGAGAGPSGPRGPTHRHRPGGRRARPLQRRPGPGDPLGRAQRGVRLPPSRSSAASPSTSAAWPASATSTPTSLVADLRAGTFGPDVETGLRDDHGVTLGHWPQSMDLSTVGGWLACRGAGQYSNRYGKIEDMVIGLEVVLADGRVVRTGGRGPRSATGPDLTQLFVGSEGTLGVITEGRFRVHPLPPMPRATGLRLRLLRRRPRRLPPHPAPRGHPGRAPALRRDRVGAVVRPCRRPTCSSSSTRATPAWSTPPWPWSTTRVRRPTRSTPAWSTAGWATATTCPPWPRCGAPASWSTPSRSRPAGRRCPASTLGARRPRTAWTGPSSPPPTSPTPTPTAPASTSPSPDARPTADLADAADHRTPGWPATTGGPGTR